MAGAGATARYANGPNAGQLVPADANGNGLLSFNYISHSRARSLDYFTNDLRATKVWKAGGGNLRDYTIVPGDFNGDGRGDLITVTSTGSPSGSAAAKVSR